MTDPDPRASWYRQQAGEKGASFLTDCLWDGWREQNEDGIEAMVTLAREAGHYGNLALDLEEGRGKPEGFFEIAARVQAQGAPAAPPRLLGRSQPDEERLPAYIGAWLYSFAPMMQQMRAAAANAGSSELRDLIGAWWRALGELYELSALGGAPHAEPEQERSQSADDRPFRLVAEWFTAADRERADDWGNTADKPIWQAIHRERADVYDGCAGALLASLSSTKLPLFVCRARPNTDPPQDCDWPHCGCDPHADRVIDALQEEGLLIGRSQPDERPGVIDDVLVWACERYWNTLRIAAEKTGLDRAGWLEDAAYWRDIIVRLDRGNVDGGGAPHAQPEPHGIATKEPLPCPSCVSLTAEIQQLKAELATWKVCADCGEALDSPGLCVAGQHEWQRAADLLWEETQTAKEVAEQARDRLLVGLQQLQEQWNDKAVMGENDFGSCAGELTALVSASLIDPRRLG